MDPKTYAEAGVDIHKADAFVARLKHSARRDGHRRLWPAAGGYASVYPVQGNLAVALTTDGVGTKLLIALEQSKLDTIGIDLVAMCVNDLLCVGATPSAFLDYYATGKLDEKLSDDLVAGIIQGCDLAGMLLVGGETAELPDLYQNGHFDLAGFAMGIVSKESLITGEALKNGDKIIGVASSGVHSNGFSLARKLIALDNPLRQSLITPTAIYAAPVVRLLNEYPGAVKGAAHITGGGWTNITRPNKSLGYVIENHLPVPEVMKYMSEKIALEEMYKTFNMGMGFCVMTAEEHVEKVLSTFQASQFNAMVVGEISGKKPALTVKGLSDKEIVYPSSAK
jgi:phosphoribosylformylglycinamidine cyclo-ligase